MKHREIDSFFLRTAVSRAGMLVGFVLPALSTPVLSKAAVIPPSGFSTFASVSLGGSSQHSGVGSTAEDSVSVLYQQSAELDGTARADVGNGTQPHAGSDIELHGSLANGALSHPFLPFGDSKAQLTYRCDVDPVSG